MFRNCAYIALIAAVSLTLGCTPTQQGAAGGAAVGALGGAIIGHNTGGNARDGAYIGAAVGGLTGALAADAAQQQPMHPGYYGNPGPGYGSYGGGGYAPSGGNFSTGGWGPTSGNIYYGRHGNSSAWGGNMNFSNQGGYSQGFHGAPSYQQPYY